MMSCDKEDDELACE